MNKKVEEAWNNAHKIRGKNPEVYRRDDYGNTIFKSSYGKQSDMGWELIIDTLYQKEEQIRLRICKQYNGKKIE